MWLSVSSLVAWSSILTSKFSSAHLQLNKFSSSSRNSKMATDWPRSPWEVWMINLVLESSAVENFPKKILREVLLKEASISCRRDKLLPQEALVRASNFLWVTQMRFSAGVEESQTTRETPKMLQSISNNAWTVKVEKGEPTLTSMELWGEQMIH